MGLCPSSRNLATVTSLQSNTEDEPVQKIDGMYIAATPPPPDPAQRTDTGNVYEEYAPPPFDDEQDDSPMHQRHIIQSGMHYRAHLLPESQLIFDCARILWKAKHLPPADPLIRDGDDFDTPFSGRKFDAHVKTHLHMITAKTPREFAEEFVSGKYVERVLPELGDSESKTMTKSDEQEEAKSEMKEESEERHIFHPSDDVLYRFNLKKRRMFLQFEYPDRVAWTKDTRIEVYSQRRGWAPGTIKGIKHDIIYVQYGTFVNQFEKTLPRYGEMVRSLPEFISSRNNWGIGSELDVYSRTYETWYLGFIKDISFCEGLEVLLVSFSVIEDGKKKDMNKFLERWSPYLRALELKPAAS